MDLEQIQKQLGYEFRDLSLLEEALIHSSYKNENRLNKDNERLELIGDAVIGLVVGEELFERHLGATEGQISLGRSHLVSRKKLGELAVENGMGDWVFLGKGEKASGGAQKKNILAGLLEAVIGALYRDGGLEAARSFILRVYKSSFESLSLEREKNQKTLDQKTFLQEMTQARFGTTPVYRLVDMWGLDHEKNFRVEIEIEGKVVAVGEGRSRKEAEQVAALGALETYS